MKIKILVFGILAEKFGKSMIEMENVENLDRLIVNLKKQYDMTDEIKFAIARNREIVKENVNLNDGDEIALLPPFAGG
jgi:molybdopterin synthase sulfur carrier subunit